MLYVVRKILLISISLRNQLSIFNVIFIFVLQSVMIALSMRVTLWTFSLNNTIWFNLFVMRLLLFCVHFLNHRWNLLSPIEFSFYLLIIIIFILILILCSFLYLLCILKIELIYILERLFVIANISWCLRSIPIVLFILWIWLFANGLFIYHCIIALILLFFIL